MVRASIEGARVAPQGLPSPATDTSRRGPKRGLIWNVVWLRRGERNHHHVCAQETTVPAIVALIRLVVVGYEIIQTPPVAGIYSQTIPSLSASRYQ